VRREAIKCMALVESHPLAFQIEEFIYNCATSAGAELGPLDYMASLIHFKPGEPEWAAGPQHHPT